MAGQARWTHPEGGMFVWVTLAPAMDAAALLRRAMARGVVFVPGDSFHPAGGGRNTLRLNFVSASEDEIREGIARLAACVAEEGE
jgi:DNA-binding transcriptional MocR family regulator